MVSVAPIAIPLSLSGPADAFAVSLEAYRADLEAHRSGAEGVPAPVAHPLLDALVTRVHRGDPLPDSFEIASYEIVDDITPPPPPPLTLEQRKAQLTGELFETAAAARNAILSPARAQLLNLDMTEALSVPEESRTADQVGAIAAYVAFQARVVEIDRNAAVAAVEIEDLSADTIDAWKVPAL